MKNILQKEGIHMNLTKLMIRISMLCSFTGIAFLILFFSNAEKFRWGLVAALVCIVAGNLINLARIKMIGKKSEKQTNFRKIYS